MPAPPPSAHDHWTLHPDRLQLSVYSIAILSHFLPETTGQAHAVFLAPHPDGGVVASILIDGALIAAYDEDGIVATPGAIVITDAEIDRILGQEVNAGDDAPDETYRIVAADNRGSNALAFCAFNLINAGQRPRVLSITPREHMHQNLGAVPPAIGSTFPKIHQTAGPSRAIPAAILAGAANLLQTIGLEHDSVEAAPVEHGLLISFTSEPNVLILVPALSSGATAEDHLQWLAGIQCPWHWAQPIESRRLH